MTDLEDKNARLRTAVEGYINALEISRKEGFSLAAENARLREAAIALYRGGQWTCPQQTPARQAEMWVALRDALGLEPGGSADAMAALSPPSASEQSVRVAGLDYHIRDDQWRQAIDQTRAVVEEAVSEQISPKPRDADFCTSSDDRQLTAAEAYARGFAAGRARHDLENAAFRTSAIAQARAEEAEACAKRCEANKYAAPVGRISSFWNEACSSDAAAIRARHAVIRGA